MFLIEPRLEGLQLEEGSGLFSNNKQVHWRTAFTLHWALIRQSRVVHYSGLLYCSYLNICLINNDPKSQFDATSLKKVSNDGFKKPRVN